MPTFFSCHCGNFDNIMTLSPPHRALFATIQDVADYLDTKGVDYSHIIKRRDPKEPGRRRKEAMEVELYLSLIHI